MPIHRSYKGRGLPVRSPQPLDRIAKARAVGYLREAREMLARASAALLTAGDGHTAGEVDATGSGIETMAEQLSERPEKPATTCPVLYAGGPVRHLFVATQRKCLCGAENAPMGL